MLEERGEVAVFLEQHFAPSGALSGLGAADPSGRASMAVECVPLSTRDGTAAPAFFKKAILEAGD